MIYARHSAALIVQAFSDYFPVAVLRQFSNCVPDALHGKSIVSWLSRMTLMASLALAVFPSHVGGQHPDVGTSVQPSSRVRLTGVVEGLPSHAVALPWITVWIGGTPWLFHVCRIEPLIPAYLAEEELRKVSGLGLRLLADQEELMALQSAAIHKRPVIITGKLGVRAGLLQVDSVHTTELAASQCSID